MPLSRAHAKARRRAILAHIADAGSGGITATELAGRVSAPSARQMRRDLELVHNAGLVVRSWTTNSHGRQMRYYITAEGQQEVAG